MLRKCNLYAATDNAKRLAAHWQTKANNKKTAVRKRTRRCKSTAASRSNSKQHHAAHLTGDAYKILNSSSQADAPLQLESGDPLLLMQAASFITSDDLPVLNSNSKAASRCSSIAARHSNSSMRHHASQLDSDDFDLFAIIEGIVFC